MVGSGRVRMEEINACTSTVYHPGKKILYLNIYEITNMRLLHSFILKTKEQRAAEKALMDKSPLKTLTLEDFLESERHKLTGKLTPVTPETFAKWKKERMNKKQAEEELRKAKEETGRAMFERGGWDESDADSDDDDDDNDTTRVEWDLERLRLETEEARQKKEEERLRGGGATDAEQDGGGAEVGTDEGEAS